MSESTACQHQQSTGQETIGEGHACQHTYAFDPVLQIDGSLVDPIHLEPTVELLSALTDRLLRQGDLSRPGYTIFPRTKWLFEHRDRAIMFQRKLVFALKQHLALHHPEAVTPQGYLDQPKDECRQQHDALGTEAFQFQAIETFSTQTFHMDNLRQSYVCLCYGPNENVRGGIPQIFDALLYQRENKLAAITDVIRLQRMSKIYTELHTAHDLEACLQSGVADEDERYIRRFEGFDADELPMLIFSNRLSDGILHGATPPGRRDPAQPSRRPISYACIKHFPFVKKEPFESTHVLRV